MATSSGRKLKPLKKPKPSNVYDRTGNAMHEYKAVLYGNNAAWICPNCGCMNIARTYKSGKEVKCCNEDACSALFKLYSDLNSKGGDLYGPAREVQLIS